MILSISSTNAGPIAATVSEFEGICVRPASRTIAVGMSIDFADFNDF